jgi:hypothetical protein
MRRSIVVLVGNDHAGTSRHKTAIKDETSHRRDGVPISELAVPTRNLKSSAALLDVHI